MDMKKVREKCVSCVYEKKKKTSLGRGNSKCKGSMVGKSLR